MSFAQERRTRRPDRSPAKTRRGAMQVWLSFSVSPNSRQSLTRFRVGVVQNEHSVAAREFHHRRSHGFGQLATHRLSRVRGPGQKDFVDPVANCSIAASADLRQESESDPPADRWLPPDPQVSEQQRAVAAGLISTAFPAAIACKNLNPRQHQRIVRRANDQHNTQRLRAASHTSSPKATSDGHVEPTVFPAEAAVLRFPEIDRHPAAAAPPPPEFQQDCRGRTRVRECREESQQSADEAFSEFKTISQRTLSPIGLCSSCSTQRMRSTISRPTQVSGMLCSRSLSRVQPQS